MMVKKRQKCLALLSFCILALLGGCGKTDGLSEQKEAPKTYSFDTAEKFEAENGTLIGSTRVSEEGGVTYVDNFAKADEDGVEISFTVPETGFYDLGFVNTSGGNYKSNYLYVDGEMIGYLETECSDYEISKISRVYLEAEKEHTAKVVAYWGYIKLDSLLVKKADELDPNRFNLEPVLCNPNASENAQRLFTYMCDIYGKQILSGQVCDGGMYGLENASIWRETGEYPAVLGMDMMNASPTNVAHGATCRTVEYALNYWEEGGIITILWHWTVPEKYGKGDWYSTFRKEKTTIKLDKIMNGEDPEGYELLASDIRKIAEDMLPLKEADVPILWRPLHEASGGWFWWGNCEAESYIKLYQMMYDIMVNEYELNNLIWVWNGQDPDWYPGDAYVDIVGIDIYPGYQVTSPMTDQFVDLLNETGSKKMIALTENGCLFDPDLAYRDGTMWSFVNTWCGEFVLLTEKMNFYSETYTTKDALHKFYESEYVVKRSQIPDLKNYPLREK